MDRRIRARRLKLEYFDVLIHPDRRQQHGRRRTDKGMAQMITPVGVRDIIVTVAYAEELMALNPGWTWESL